jgi:hypothetical protein
MRIRTTLWLIAVAGCVALGIRQKDNLSAILREYISVRRDLEYSKGSPELRKPVIRSSIGQIDPEAAAVAELTFSDSNFYENIDFLADSALEFPDNRFFPYGIAQLTVRDTYWGLDPQIPIAITMRLSQVEPNNAIYHYLAAEAMLISRRGNDLGGVLAEVEQANRCSENRCPCDDYTSKVSQIAEKAGLSRILMKQFTWPEKWQFRNRLLWRYLMQFANTSFTNNDYPVAFRISDDLKKTSDCHTIGRFLYSAGSIGPFTNTFGQRRSIEEIELQRTVISKELAQQDRLRLSARLAGNIETERQREKPVQVQQRRPSDTALMLSAIAAVHLLNMLPAFTAAIIIMLLFCFAFGFGQWSGITVRSIVFFTIGCAVFFFAARGVFIFVMFDQLGCSYHEAETFFASMRMHMVDISDLIKSPLSLFLIGAPVTWFILKIMSFLRPTKGRFWRWWYVKVFWAVAISAILTILFLVPVAGHRDFADHKDFTMQTLLPAAILFLIFAFIVWVLIMFGWWLYSCRIVRIILIAIFLGVLTLFMDGYFFVSYLPAVIFVLIVSGMAAANRINMIRLLSAFLIVYWVLLIALSPLCAQFINRHLEFDDSYWKKVVKFEPDQASYDYVMNELGDPKLTKINFCNLVKAVMPEDMEMILRSAETKEFYLDRTEAFSFRLGMSPEEMSVLTEEKEKQKKLTDLDLCLLIQRCGRDVTAILTSFLDEPNNPRALVSRASKGDMTAKKPLEELLQAYLQADPNLDDINDHGEMFLYRPPMRQRPDHSLDDPNVRQGGAWRGRGRMFSPYLRPVNAYDMIPALAVVSEPNEAALHYLDYIQRRGMCDLIIDHRFFENIVLLPTSQARQVMKAYLAKATEWQRTGQAVCRESPSHINMERILLPIRDLIEIYADREIAENIFTMLLGTENNDWFEGWQIWPHLTIESAELLKKGLASSNDRFRAWSVWQLRRVGYQFTQEEIDKLLKDDSWMVRANAVMAEPEMAKNIAANDKNSFVRFVATLSADRP